jgi:hypothetical protein
MWDVIIGVAMFIVFLGIFGLFVPNPSKGRGGGGGGYSIGSSPTMGH